MVLLIRLLLLIGLLAPGGQAIGQAPNPAIAAIGQASTREAGAVHWAVALGLRVEQVSRAFPTVDRVVLVPDAATYLDELSKWSPRGRWPVLFLDRHFAPMFVRRFQPAQVIRRDPVEGGAEITRAQLEAVVVRAWGGNPEREAIGDVFERLGYVPPGVVIASTEDPAWTAAVALAAGRGQPIAWLDASFAHPNQALTPDQMSRLQAELDRHLAATGHPYAALGDAIDAITLCRAVGGKVNLAPDGTKAEIRAVTDVLGRDGYGPRYACTGWIFGDEARCAYVAMCSLFLDRTRFMLFNTYPADGGWEAYDVDGASARLTAWGASAVARRGGQADLRAWLGMLPGGVRHDVFAMNSKGNATFFDLADGRASVGDVPVLNEPAAVHFIHSWSMRSPESPTTVAGRWLERGAYAYVGSTDEPQLAAFMPPTELTRRWTAGVPFLVAARRWDDSPAWKVNTFGDPLMCCRRPGTSAPRTATPAEYGHDLRALATAVMRRANATGDGAAFAEAIALLALLGEDEIAYRLWELAVERGHGPAAASAALPSLFRLRRVDAFIAAWRETGDPDTAATDMLWHLLTPRLGMAGGPELLLLEEAIRSDQPDADLGRLAPRLAAVFGAAHARIVIQHEIDRAERAATRRKLQQLMKTIN
jgi:hypothetical protein